MTFQEVAASADFSIAFSFYLIPKWCKVWSANWPFSTRNPASSAPSWAPRKSFLCLWAYQANCIPTWLHLLLNYPCLIIRMDYTKFEDFLHLNLNLEKCLCSRILGLAVSVRKIRFLIWGPWTFLALNSLLASLAETVCGLLEKTKLFSSLFMN